jgi:hypothetical protein
VFTDCSQSLLQKTTVCLNYSFIPFNVSDFVFLCKGYGVLQSSLTLLLEEGDFDPDLRFKTVNITKMATYILTNMMRAFEDKLSQKSSNGILVDTGKVR